MAGTIPRQLVAAAAHCWHGLADLLLPAVCCACQADDIAEQGLCGACQAAMLRQVATPYCPRCGATLGPGVPPRSDGCRECDSLLPRYEHLFRLGPYADPLRAIIRQLKYHRQETMRRPLGAMLAEAIRAQPSAPRLDVVLAVPMHWRRRLMRGYDHARALAEAIAAPLGMSVGDELVRVKPTPPQANLPRTRRIENVRGAFEVRRPWGLQGASILLVDDVCTTGATVGEAAKALLAAGAEHVLVAVIAKAEAPTAYAEWKQKA